MGIGIFYRQHPGEIQNLSIPIKVDYSAIGMSIAPGIRLRINDTWNVDWKIEVGAGKTVNVTLDSPGVNWNATKRDRYASLSPIVGCFYLFEHSASRVGLEVGYQKFWGDFGIWSNYGHWSQGTLSGVNLTVNLVYGPKNSDRNQSTLRQQDKQPFFQPMPCAVTGYARARTRDTLVMLKRMQHRGDEDKRSPLSARADASCSIPNVRPESGSPRNISAGCPEPCSAGPLPLPASKSPALRDARSDRRSAPASSEMSQWYGDPRLPDRQDA
jgi:hypothetical protein